MAQSPVIEQSPATLGDYLKNWDALGSMIVRGRPFSGFERHCAFLNTGTADGSLTRFANVSAASGLDLLDDGRALASGDWDGDGDLDYWLTNRTAPRLRLLRNNLPAEKASASVSFDLVGTLCNRDAIGALLTVQAGTHSQTRVLRAGDGFQSQSSKRLHVGLASYPADQPLKVSVRWPHGRAETFSGVVPGKRYRLKQGNGKAELVDAGLSPLKDGAIEPEPATEVARLVFTERHSAAALEYFDFEGQAKVFGPKEAAGSPVLVILWASWCPHCREELKDLAAHHGELSAKGVKVLALSTEGVSEDGSKPDLAGARALVDEHQFPFPVGLASAESLRLLTVLQQRSLARQRPLPLPCSFLVDQHGRLAVLYKGPVDGKQLLEDIALLGGTGDAIVREAFPYPSRDGLELFGVSDFDFAQAYQAGGYIEDARRAAKEGIEHDPSRSWYYLGTLEQSQGNWEAAAHAYGEALKITPDHPLLGVALGVVLWQGGKQEAAQTWFDRAQLAGKEDVKILTALAKANLQIGRAQEAVILLKQARVLKQDDLTLALTLALAHEEANDFKAALALYQSLLQVHPGASEIMNRLARLHVTSTDSAIKDGPRALALATAVVRQTKSRNASALETLALAQAANGNAVGARKTIERALALARATGQRELRDRLREQQASLP